jgi:diaminohydroxyphosphoribosylaminopyrimidine deaminase/5-amino-6-(5-phosphoribosylamino)uracil reductase
VAQDSQFNFMREALRLARRGYGATSPNPMVGAVLLKSGKIIGRGWHRRAGLPHAEIEALHDALKRGQNPLGATLYVTLEPCCTQGRTPPCTDAIIAAGIKKVIVGAIDSNPKHAGRAFKILRRAGIAVDWWGGGSATCEQEREPRWSSAKTGSRVRSPHQPFAYQQLADECVRLNEAFNHWIVHRTPFVTVKAAMTLDGKIATANGQSKWITGEKARALGMNLRQGSDAILVGINTILADDPSLTVRSGVPVSDPAPGRIASNRAGSETGAPKLRRIVLDSLARTPLRSKVVSDEFAALTTIVVSKSAPKKRVAELRKRVNVIIAPTIKKGRAVYRLPRRARSDAPYQQIGLRWLIRKLGAENVTSLLVEGGGQVNASFLLGNFAQRVVFFYAPKILGGRDSRKAVAGDGARKLSEVLQLREIEWKQVGADLMMTARVANSR